MFNRHHNDTIIVYLFCDSPTLNEQESAVLWIHAHIPVLSCGPYQESKVHRVVVEKKFKL